MGRKESRFKTRLNNFLRQGKMPGKSEDEGVFKVEFTFDGKKYARKHSLSPSEMKLMKDLCRDHGDQAADQIVWRAAVKGCSMLAEGVISQAGYEYQRDHFVPRMGTANPEGSTEVSAEEKSAVASISETSGDQ